MFQTKPKSLSRQQRAVWDELNKYIAQEGGWIVSQPDVSPIRFECPMGSELPALLRQAGHRVIDYGKHERLMPVVEVMKEHGRAKAIKREQVGVGIVGVWQFDLPPVFAANAETRTCAGI